MDFVCPICGTQVDDPYAAKPVAASDGGLVLAHSACLMRAAQAASIPALVPASVYFDPAVRSDQILTLARAVVSVFEMATLKGSPASCVAIVDAMNAAEPIARAILAAQDPPSAQAVPVDEVPPGQPLTDAQVRECEAHLPVPETAPEAWLVDRVRHLILTLRAEQERHRETRYEWEMACERERALREDLAAAEAMQHYCPTHKSEAGEWCGDYAADASCERRRAIARGVPDAD